MISVWQIGDNPTLVFIGFSNGAVDKVFCMPVPAARRCIPKGCASNKPIDAAATRNETAVIKHFQERMPYGLFVPGDAQCDTVAL